MPRWLGDVLKAVHRHARRASVRVTYKALLEMVHLEASEDEVEEDEDAPG